MAKASAPIYWHELFAEGMQKLPRDTSGHVKTADLLKYACDNGKFDYAKAQLAEMKRRLRACCAHGSKYAGQLIFANAKPFAYEPDRLILSADGKRLIELERASILDIIADTERSAVNRQRVDARDDLKRFQQMAFSGWVSKEQDAARPSSELTFGNFVKESGALHMDSDIGDEPSDRDDNGDPPDDDDDDFEL